MSEPDLGPDRGIVGDVKGAGEEASSGTRPGRSVAPEELATSFSFLGPRLSFSPLSGRLASRLLKPGGADMRGALVAALALFSPREEAESSIARISTSGLAPSSSIWRSDPMRTRYFCRVTANRGSARRAGGTSERKNRGEHPKSRAFLFSAAFDMRRVRAYRTSRRTEIAGARVAEESNGHYEAEHAPQVPTCVVECARRGLALGLPTLAIGRSRCSGTQHESFVNRFGDRIGHFW